MLKSWGCGGRVVISAGRNYFSRPGGRNWQKLAETGLNRQKLAEIKKPQFDGLK